MLPFNRKIELSPRLKLSVGRGYSPNQKLKIAAVCLLVLAVGLTVNAVRLIFFVPGGAQPSSAPQVLGASDTKTLPDSEIKFEEYKVQKNDTLFSISQAYNVSWTILATLNNLKSPFIVKPGQSLKIPKQ